MVLCDIFAEFYLNFNFTIIKNFHKIIFKSKIKMKRNFIIYHFLVKSKPHEITDLLITACVKVYQTKKSMSIVMKTCFS